MIGRFAPTPSGRMHLGNILCALLAWSSAKRQNGKVLLRIEDIDTARCTGNGFTEHLIDDLHWLGLDFDGGETPDTYQSQRTPIYTAYFEKLAARGLLYPCYCTRAERHAAQAPHAADGQVIYDGHCRRYLQGETPPDRVPAWRLMVPARDITFTDGLQGVYTESLSTACGDFLVRRSDGIFAYQLAVVVDDALSGVTEVVRGRDLLSSTPRQLYLYELFGFTPPQYYHIPLLLRADGTRLAKRDHALDSGQLREKYPAPEPLIGMLAYNCGLTDRYIPLSASAFAARFSWEHLRSTDIRLDTCGLL